MSTMKEKVLDAGHVVADTAKSVGHKIAEGAEQAADWVKDKVGMGATAGVKEHMDVIASCGKKVGVVDHVEGDAIKLTRNDSPDGQHHFIPMGWVDHVDNHVHLKKNSMETEMGWKPDAASCGCGA
ncbi:DUF2171 domain-containing protein [Limnoglobus roseus]|uniref:DUF2171 domain-containing protein n=1 Tax=Limnoglobus roseus TaxID=2598579 RepID=A0A5C1ASJ1_9BACT|nr:DUF2171 domain-containing protein [Limnoglobus roseus]QEL21006.1 hypothetical protein PX52LOC_08135 [Limnoglobus roseus]